MTDKEMETAAQEFWEDVEKEATERELLKKELFQESRLKINLPKFNGYDSKLDIYTFQTEFLKVYERTTPKRMLSDVLKNNLLEGPALSLVTSVDDISEIWARLKRAFGDPKMLLKRKIAQVGKITSLWKLRDPEKLTETLSKLINVMKIFKN